MANEQQYFNPIIQAMAQTVQAQQNQQRLEQEQERQKQEIAASKLQGAQQNRAHDLAELSEKHHNEHENAMLDIQHSLLQASQQANAANRIKTIHDIIMHGGTAAEVAPITPEGSTIPDAASVGQFNSQQAGAMEGAKTQAQQDILFPQQKELQSNLFTQQKTLQDYAHDFEMKKQAAGIQGQKDIAASNRASAEKIAGMSEGNAYRIAQMHDNTTKMINGMGGSEGASDLINHMVDLAASGQIKLNPSNKMEATALAALDAHGFKNPDPKDIAAMKASQKLIPIFDKLREYANTLPDDRTAATLQGYALHGKQAINMGSKQQTDLDNILSQASTVGTSLENITGRPLAGQLKLELNSLIQPGNTKSDVLSKVNNLQNTYVNNQENVTQGGMPDAQKELLARRQGVLPSYLATAPQKSKIGGTLDLAESIKRKTPIYSGGQQPTPQIPVPAPQGPTNAPVQ